MSVSSATVNPNSLELTPMRVTYNGVDLGATLSNVVITPKATKAPLKADQLGTTIIDQRVSGHEMMVVTEIAEIKNKDRLKVAFPWINEVTSGPNKQLYADSQVGRSDQSDAQELILHPLSLADVDLSGDWKFYKAVAMGDGEFTYGPEGQVKVKVTWRILPDFTTNPPRFFVHGDPSIGLVAASVGTVTYSGTGNGTMTGKTAFTGVTKTETITATCIHATTDGGIFEVIGSLSGNLGNAYVGVGFVSPYVAFTINDGSTDFIVGDQFTIPTVAGNYV
jgi:hypothetical protein